MTPRRRVFVAVVGILAVLSGLTPGAHAGGIPPDELVSCQSANPSGAPISITILTRSPLNISGLTVTVGELSVLASFRGQTFGPLTVFDAVATDVGNTLDAGCKLFNDSGLSAQILSAAGLPGTTLNFTNCSFLGSSDPSCTARPGTINAPLGWTANQITGYAGH